MAISRRLGWQLGMVGIVVGVVLAPGAWGQQSVHPFQLKASAVFEELIGGDVRIFKEKASSDVLVQLARGRSLGEKPPDNEILAVVVDCGASPTPFVTRIVVWDTVQGMVLEEVSQPIDTEDAVFETRDGPMNIVEVQFIADVDLNATGDPGVNAIDGGDWKVAGVAKIDPNSPDGCPKSMKAAILGTFDLTLTDAGGANQLETLVTKAKGTAKKPIATIPAP